jgi:hypothetical protein
MRQLQRGHLRSHDRQLQRKQLQFMRGRALLVVRSVGLHVVWHRNLHGHHRGIVLFVLWQGLLLRRDGALGFRFLPLRCRQILGCGRFCVHCLRGRAPPSLHGTERVRCLQRRDLRKQHRLNRM